MSLTDKQIELGKQNLEDLKKDTKLSYRDLSRAIEKSQGVKISSATLGKYVINEKKSNLESLHDDYDLFAGMSVKRLVALADYFHVPVDYLLGRTPCKDATNVEIHKRIGLSDDAIKNLEYSVKKDKPLSYSPLSKSHSEIINTLLSDKRFYEAIDFIALSQELKQKKDYCAQLEEYAYDADNNYAYAQLLLFEAQTRITSLLQSHFQVNFEQRFDIINSQSNSEPN